MSRQAHDFSRLGRWLGLWVVLLVLPGIAALMFIASWLHGSAAVSFPDDWSYVLIGSLALTLLLALGAFIFIRRRVLLPLRVLARHIDVMSAGDLTQRIDNNTANEMGAVLALLRHLQEQLNRMTQGVHHGMAAIAAGKQNIVAGNADLGSRTELQASALQQSVVSMEELSATVRQNADNARQANQLASAASSVAQRGGKAVAEVVATMNGISDSSRKISDIVGVIDSIAFQTNILALNAAVEAARAGEQGKGFAVVASEVRALAQRSAQAAKEIKTLIDDSVRKVSEGSGQVETAGTTMQEIVESVARVTDIMGEISAATSEQASGIDEINRVISSMDEMTRNNATLVHQEAMAISTLDDDVTQVLRVVSAFRSREAGIVQLSAAALPAGSPSAAEPISGDSDAHFRTVKSPVKPPALAVQASPLQQNVIGPSSPGGRDPVHEQGRPSAHALPSVRTRTASRHSSVEKSNGGVSGARDTAIRTIGHKPQALADDDWIEF